MKIIGYIGIILFVIVGTMIPNTTLEEDKTFHNFVMILCYCIAFAIALYIDEIAGNEVYKTPVQGSMDEIFKDTERRHFHAILYKLLLQKGEQHPKKNGVWIMLRIRELTFVEADSANKSIKLKSGRPHNLREFGFGGITIIDFGKDDVFYESSATAEQYEELIKEIETLKEKPA